MSLKFLIPSLGVAAVVFSSCAPLTPYRPAPIGVDPQQPVLTPEQKAAEAKAAEQKRVQKARDEARRKAREREAARNNPSSSNGTSAKPPENKPKLSKPDYRRAIPIPGKEGFVFNPFTNNPVDVRGIPSGQLVRDPQDSNMEHKFRVP